MSSCVCILHSTGASCSRELISQAVYGTSAVFHSVINSSPDFIPSVAVLRANPIEGVRYAYTSCANDAPHETEKEGETEEDQEEERENSDRRKMRRIDREMSAVTTETELSSKNNDAQPHSLMEIFGGRSALGLQRAIMRCVDDADKSGCVRDDTDRWACLAGALLTSCCFLRARITQDEMGDDVTPGSNNNNNTNTNNNNDDSNKNKNNTGVPSRGGCIMVFSDVCDTHALSFATECAFSAAAVATTKLHAAVHVFGPATQSSSVARRLQALANATGGVCAPAFAFAHVGRLLTSDISAMTTRQLRERLVEQYVVQPFNLPRDAGSVAETHDGNASSLAWLCPACMAVVVRRAVESGSARKCPYCAVDNGSDGEY
ncbi:uncharacterized protein TM35_000221690 [Trypanosoma theileri]|uniref:TFIIH basal transcription factor subunit n=1 Tax=Trypanosoma theileri TaxID=67003 RepID=A0A1X0NTD1_9TRYP|nr:uncharacterized protein TM35_000221690 [Trypanosoma theileri]ORC87370.1 hypothetical protein TM35_000221690 [Trypanosoma theileri]